MGRVAAMDRDERNHWQSFFRHSATVGVLISSQHISYERNWAAGKSSIFGTLAFLITKLVSLLSGRTVVWLVYNWGLFHLWVMGMSSNWLKQKKKKKERERDYMDSYTGKFTEILGNSGMGWPGLRDSTHILRNVLLPSSVLPHSLFLKQALSTKCKDGHQQLQICVLQPNTPSGKHVLLPLFNNISKSLKGVM